MKKAVYLVVISVCLCIYASAQMDNLVNVSANWVASPARNAATDAADVVVYNPAAAASLSEGFHVNIGNQSLFRKPTHTYDLGMGVKTSGQNGSDPFLPNIYAAYVKNNWSVFTGIFVSGGGATLNYPEGSLTTDMIGFQSVMAAEGAYAEAGNQFLKASSFYITGALGFAYKINEIVSASVGMRYLNGMNKTQAGITLTSSPIDLPDMPMEVKYDETANGIGAVAGIFIRPSDKLGLSLRYESQVTMDFKTKLNKDDFGFITDGSKNRRDLPSVLAFGVSHKINDKFTALADVNYYMQEGADWGNTTDANGETVSLSKTAGNAISYCLAVNYRINEKVACSVGGGYTDYMFNDMDAYYTHAGVFETVQNDNMNLNIGGSYLVSKRVNLTAGFMHTAWTKDTKVKALMISPDSEVTINNSMNVVAIGADIKF
jgi:long-chain fatty acid transport protein